MEGVFLALGFLACFGVARWFSTDVAGGSDSYGYVSEAVRLSRGHLFERETVLSPFGMPEDARRTHPLGYLEKGREGTVPAYPFGYPLLMAPAIRIFGVRAAYWLTPLLAAGAVLLTYWLGRACLGSVGGALAALLLAALPNFVSGAFQPMSDVPATFFCVLALVALLAAPRRSWADILLGAALGFGVWVRPNMGLLIGVASLWLSVRREWPRLARMGFALAPFLLIEGFANWHLFGAPWRTGYGTLPLAAQLPEALARGGRHLLRLNTQQAGVGLALFAVALAWNRLDLARRAVLAGVLAAFLCFFAAYRFDDAWWYFRFLLPAVPAVTVVEAGLLLRLTSPGRLRSLRVAVVTLGTCALLLGSLSFARQNGVFDGREAEQKYPRVAAFVASRVEAPAFVLAMQHSGTLRFYAGLATARYDLGSSEELSMSLDEVASAGGNLYLVAEGSELDWIVRNGRRFLLDHAVRLGTVEPGGVALFRLDEGHFARERSGAVALSTSSEKEVAFRGGWGRAEGRWRLDGTGSIQLDGGAQPAVARVCAGVEPLLLARSGYPVGTVASHTCAEVPLVPGPAGELAVSPSRSATAMLPPVTLSPLSRMQSTDQLTTAYMVPQVAHVKGFGGSSWQTDLLLVNPQARSLAVTAHFLVSGKDNSKVSVVSMSMAPRSERRLSDVLTLPEFGGCGDLGALLVVAGEPAKPCLTVDCRFVVLARTFNSQAAGGPEGAGEWLPGLPFEVGMASGRASFGRFFKRVGHRASVGVASWTDRPVWVRVNSGGGPKGPGRDRDVEVPAFGHLRIGLGGEQSVGPIEVELLGAVSGARVFPYFSVVDGESGRPTHFLPDEVGDRNGTRHPPLPIVAVCEGRHDK